MQALLANQSTLALALSLRPAADCTFFALDHLVALWYTNPLLTEVFPCAVSSGITALNSVFSSVPAGITPIGSPRLSSALGSVDCATYEKEGWKEEGKEERREERKGGREGGCEKLHLSGSPD